MAYTKLFQSILTSTIWVESDRTRIVWITMLALADKNGEVQASIPGLARVAGVPVADCEQAITLFLAPDPYSRTPDDEGRRIERIDGGWLLLNHDKYRRLASKDESKEAAAERQRRRREREIRNAAPGEIVNVTPCHALSRSVTHRHAPSRTVTENRDIADTDAEADTDNTNSEGTPTGVVSESPEVKANPKPPKAFIPPAPAEVESYSAEIGYPLNGQAWCDAYAQKGWMVGRAKMKDWRAAVRNWKANGYRLAPQHHVSPPPPAPPYRQMDNLRPGYQR